jgi:RNA polymerase sigma-70 factor (ECF subfamily)
MAAYDANERAIQSICWRYAKKPEDREDLLQDIMIQLWTSYPGFQHKSKIGTWMYKIAKRTAKRRFSARDSYIELDVEIPDRQYDEHAFDELDQSPLSFMLRLSEQDQEILHHIGEGYTHKEIAEILGMGKSTVEAHLKTIRIIAKNN